MADCESQKSLYYHYLLQIKFLPSDFMRCIITIVLHKYKRLRKPITLSIVKYNTHII